MSANLIGRRFERLLFFAAPLAVASLLVMFVALASDQQEERKRAKCLRSVVETINVHQADLEQAQQGRRVVIRGTATTDYWLALRFVLIPWEVTNPKCVQHYPAFNDKAKLATPKALMEKALTEAAALESKPLSLYGIELPEKATLSLLGTPIKMDLTTLVRVMQFALAPVLVLWLSSLYQTRHRETLLIARLSDVSALYPHLMNVYPVSLRGDAAWEPPRRKSWSKFLFLKYCLPAICALTRISLLSVFIGPPIGFYFSSIYLLRGDDFSIVSAAMGIVVGFFAFATAVSEFLPWHVQKRFRVSFSSTT